MGDILVEDEDGGGVEGSVRGHCHPGGVRRHRSAVAEIMDGAEDGLDRCNAVRTLRAACNGVGSGVGAMGAAFR